MLPMLIKTVDFLIIWLPKIASWLPIIESILEKLNDTSDQLKQKHADKVAAKAEKSAK